MRRARRTGVGDGRVESGGGGVFADRFQRGRGSAALGKTAMHFVYSRQAADDRRCRRPGASLQCFCAKPLFLLLLSLLMLTPSLLTREKGRGEGGGEAAE